MRKCFSKVLAASAAITWLSSAAPAQNSPVVTDEQVVQAMRKGVDYLLKRRKPDKSWEYGPFEQSWDKEKGGETALVLYALLHAGESMQDDTDYNSKLKWRSKEMLPSVEWLEKNMAGATYVAGLEASALSLLPQIQKPQEGPHRALQSCKSYLLSEIGPDGGYTYPKERLRAPKKKGEFDLSNTQYAILGAWALTDWGIEMPDAYWQLSDRFWRRMQREDGGWPYKLGRDYKSTATMTCAGLASLYICQEFVDTELRLVPQPDKNIEAGLAWITKEYKPIDNDYYMYGVERVGLASGLKFFGTVDWYRKGAADIVKRQQPNGSWAGAVNGISDKTSPGNVHTAYALLFLSRGRNPVLFNKLQYNGPWNARPRDDAYITRWMSKQVEKPLNWQVVNLQVSPQEWLDAPILLITGSQDPKFTEKDVEKLRTFVNAGGMIFSTADGGSMTFTTAMNNYATQIVNNKYEMRVLPKDHVLFDQDIFYKGEGRDINNPPTMFGVSNGVREFWIHSPQDLGADWQQRRFASECSFEVGRALYFYASGKATLRSKLQPLVVQDKGGAAARSIHVARVDYAGNADPEPGAWARMAKLAKSNFKTDLKLATVKFADLDARQQPLAHLTGTNKVTFTGHDARALKTYLDAGGILFVDAAGGSEDFAASVKELLAKACPGSTLAAMLPNHPIYAGTMPDGVKIDSIEFRKFGNYKLKRRVTSPALETLEINGKTRVVFSNWDVCTGFLGTNTWGIMGYAPASSEALGRNILLYAAGEKKTK